MLERYQPKTPAERAVRVAVGPAALVSAGVGVAIGVLAGLPVWATVLVALGCWSLREAAGVVGYVRRSLRPHTDIDPYAVPEPWRSMVRQAVDARDRFGSIVERWPAGPTRERLEGLSTRISLGTDQVARMAQQAADLHAADRQADAPALSRELETLQRSDAGGAGAAGAGRGGAGALHEDDLARRLRSAREMEATSQQMSDRLGVLVAQLNDAVTHLVRLSAPPPDHEHAGDALGPIEGVVQQLESLHLARGELQGRSG